MTSIEKLDADFKKYVQQPDMKWDLAEGALLIARQEYSKLDTGKYLADIQKMSATAAELMGAQSTKNEKLTRLNQFFFEEMGFRGDTENYYDSRNSYLSDVMDRKLGIPITLSALYLKLAWEAGCPLFGINFPGHFLVAWKESAIDIDQNIYLDVFNEGEILKREELTALLGRSSQSKPKLEPAVHLRNAGVREILHRILANLKVIHAANDKIDRALWTAEWMLLLKPNDWNSLRDKGMFCYSLERFDEAEKALETYLENTGTPADYSHVWQVLYALRARNPFNLN